MKTIYLVRHAKSNLKEPGLPDFERPLLEKGKKRTKKIIDYLVSKKVQPDLIMSSPAKRAIETARYIAKGITYPPEKIKSLSYYYKIDSRGMLNEFMDFNDEFNTVMIIGHNPAITNFVNHFLQKEIDSLPTSGVVCIHFETNRWDSIEKAEVKPGFIIYPSLLKKS